MKVLSVYDCLTEECLGYGPVVPFLVCRLRENSLFAVTCLEGSCALVSNNEGKVKTPYLVSAVSACNGTTASFFVLWLSIQCHQLHGGDCRLDRRGGKLNRERDSSCLLTVER